MVTAIVTIVMFLVMVSFHEFGHFITAKLMNFKILEYSIGFGPAIWHSKKSEIQYSLRAIPFGGYCKFEGEDEKSEDKRAFSNQPVWKRMIVVAAGGIFNVILGFVLFLFIVPALSPISTNVIDEVVENSYIEEAGILPGDEVVEINGKHVSFYNDISLYTQDFQAGEECELVVKRDGEKLSFTFRPSESVTEYTYTDEGIEVTSSMNGVSEETVLYRYGEGAERDDSKIGTTETVTRLIIGFRPQQEDINALNIWGEAWNETKFVVKLVYNSLWQMVTGRVGMDQMGGPVGIVSEVNNAVNSGSESWLYVLNLTALLTINLGVFNLLPIPALDGGRLLFMIIELIRRKPIPPEKEGIVHAIGFLLLIALIIAVSFNDIMRLIR
ncbi:MAG TPA: site-2 protease family protein [Candidatus Ornithomonoglobus merdipullorum]|uniref:Site-2 protease family protein n=1 Tax=Candidatus Ornithomonoglobus merdipullorum TaxID=2840895 RepID=A0A9D1M9V9_9FIRM|nr:site-2 protease family protein [Candidatus Ornithomonoglobus merdipullorum]